MFFIFIVGTRFVTWGSEPSGQQMRCGDCGAVGRFVNKTGMRFVTLFFIPVIPAGGRKQLLQCAVCGARYQAR
ncbi:MAG TPA: zinc-ribbon domain-containing protein [Pyrinomonadaceae bacterium]